MLVPTPQYISQIIEKLEELKSRKSDFWKNEAKEVEALAESFDWRYNQLSVEKFIEELGEKGKSLDELYGAEIWAAVKGEELPHKFTQKPHRHLSWDEMICGINVWFENRIHTFPTSVLQGLMDQVILPLYRNDEIQVIDNKGKRTEEGKRLDSLRDAINSELKRQTKHIRNAKSQEQSLREVCKIATSDRLCEHGWPDHIQTLINEIDVLLSPYDEFLASSGSWGANEQKTIQFALKSPKAEDLKEVIHELNRVESKLKVGAKHKAAEPEQKDKPQKKDGLTGEALALAMLVEHPDWPDKKIAEAVGVNRTTLYNWPNFKKAKEALKQGKKKFPKGSKNGETGDMEAWEDDI